MRIISARIEHARYARDFGQVEAMVAFLVKDATRPVPYMLRRRTTVDALGDAPLRQRLIASAHALLSCRTTAAIGLSHAA